MSSASLPVDDRADLEARLAEVLKFLGHDAREGHSSTLALLELQRIKPDPMTLAQLAERVEANARKSLAAIDDFVDLARARTQPLRLEEIDLVDLMVEVVADAWPSASGRGIRIQMAEHPEVMTGSADRELLSRALAKLLRDTVADAARGTAIGCALREDDDGWEFDIQAHAVASPAAQAGAQEEAGAKRKASGLALATLVAQRHGGSLQVRRQPDGEVLQRLQLPRTA